MITLIHCKIQGINLKFFSVGTPGHTGTRIVSNLNELFKKRNFASLNKLSIRGATTPPPFFKYPLLFFISAPFPW